MMHILAWTVIILHLIAVIGGPLHIGKPKSPSNHTAGEYIWRLVGSAIVIALALRVLGRL
jgi:hypothetical protein